MKAVDFFCSAGGVTCGFKQAGIDVLGGIDIDPACKETYELNNNAKYLCEDVSHLDKKKVGKFFKIRKNQRDLVFVGCSPCQYYSNIKTDKTKSEGTRLLLADFQDFVAYYRPGYVFIENVPGLDKKPNSPLGRYVLRATRLKKKIKLPRENRNDIRTVYQTIGDYKTFQPIPAGYIDQTEFMHSSAGLEEINMQRITNTPHNGGDRRNWPLELIPGCYENHDGHTDVYGRMHWEKPSPTITTRFASYSNGRYGHPEQNRAISLREGASLQSFPIDYIFHSESQGTIAKMIGNAVPPLLAKAIGTSLLGKTL
jgi:DNA (cytosine-5)-methyltransferase 1